MVKSEPNIFLFCDESFERYRSNNTHVLGVCAGVLVPDFFLEDFIMTLTQILEKYRVHINPRDKLHITAFPENIHDNVQNDILEFLTHKNIVCIYDAINVIKYKEFKQANFNQAAIIKQLKKRGLFFEKIESNKPSEDVIYELAYALILKGLDYCNMHTNPPTYMLNIVPDRIDVIECEFHKIISKIKNPGSESEYTFNDSKKKRLVVSKVAIKSDVDLNKKFELNLILQSVGWKLPLLGADVLANTLLHHLNKKSEGYNSNKAIVDHPLLSKLNFHHSDFSDKLYNNHG
jgi:hypothetical protein